MEKVVRGIPTQTFWSGRRVLLTGHTGFKGIWMSHWLRFLGAEVMGLSYSGYESTVLSKSPSSVMAEIDHDLLSRVWQEKVNDFAPEIVFHLAAQSLVYSGWPLLPDLRLAALTLQCVLILFRHQQNLLHQLVDLIGELLLHTLLHRNPAELLKQTQARAG